ncbi:MAG: DUF423 domain-containing protein [Deltaproteobacteria bacterium]|nr:MAG: DUF423 domain-containing protein [Deltaproteobacteria bacterium]
MSRFGVTGAVLGGLAVAAGAFGAHGLREALSPASLAIWKTGAEYHLIHALALVATALTLAWRPSRSARVAAWSFLVGVLVFSGSLYLLAVTDLLWLGAITPIGGVAFIVGWGALAWAFRGTSGT